jgi:hypothetical protein
MGPNVIFCVWMWMGLQEFCTSELGRMPLPLVQRIDLGVSKTHSGKIPRTPNISRPLLLYFCT